jgi:hypothetical protein
VDLPSIIELPEWGDFGWTTEEKMSVLLRFIANLRPTDRTLDDHIEIVSRELAVMYTDHPMRNDTFREDHAFVYVCHELHTRR